MAWTIRERQCGMSQESFSIMTRNTKNTLLHNPEYKYAHV